MIDSTFKWKSWMMVNSLGVVYIVVHLEKKGKNEKKEENKRKNRSPGMCRLLVRHPCRSCHDRLPSHTLLLPLLVTHNLPLIYKVMGEGKLWPGTSIWILLEIRNKHCQYYGSKKNTDMSFAGLLGSPWTQWAAVRIHLRQHQSEQ